MTETAEFKRLQEADISGAPWRRWGPYLSERQWGTVREDYSDAGDAWKHFTHDQARSRAYRWGEDGLAGISDDRQQLCFALALWNGIDPILKERAFGLDNAEGNHGEDVKEYYFYLDNTPTHSYMKYLYKYPQKAYPYDTIVQTSANLSRNDLEYELIDTGVFDKDRYFDVVVEYAKESVEEILVRITVHNRGPEDAEIHILPTLWFRNTWSWGDDAQRPELNCVPLKTNVSAIHANHRALGDIYLYCYGKPELLFTENETNRERLYGEQNERPYVKDSFHQHIIDGRTDAVNHRNGTKACADYKFLIPSNDSRVLRLRLSRVSPTGFENGSKFLDSQHDAVFAERLREADEFYDSITPEAVSDDEAFVMRQALSGMLWTKQYYNFDLDKWLEEHGAHPLASREHRYSRNAEWFHMVNEDIISMPDKWEYPWYAAWDLAFHTISLSMVDLTFAKEQLDLMLRELYLHPSGQLPAYEWNFSDVNPPVHAWAVLFLYRTEKELKGKGDLDFLKHAFQKLLLNFTWWVNRKDPTGRNVFEGGFLGLDNISVFDRSKPLPTGGHLEQADGTAWMAMFCQNMLEISTELAIHDPVYQHIAVKFMEHFFWIASSMDRIGILEDEMWDEEDGFFYDLLRQPNGHGYRLKVRSLVGLLPLCATTVIPQEFIDRFPDVFRRLRTFLSRHPELAPNLAPPFDSGVKGRRLLAILNEQKLRRILSRMLDENEFLSPYGIRSLSRHHAEDPYVFVLDGVDFRVDYLPAESDSGLFGGNSNWRGPIWFPLNALIIRALIQFYLYYGDAFKVECPTGSGNFMTLFEVARDISSRLSRIFLRNENGERPVFGGAHKFQSDPYWRDHILFYEYFHGDNGAGLGASHQTGWTGIIARFIQFFGHVNQAELLADTHTPPVARIFRKAQGFSQAS